MEMIMGLDMYLYGKDGDEAGYWRKANQIHRWFVENVQDGEDDGSAYPVSREKIGELLGLVERVLADTSTAHELLPTMRGFFFGTTEYGEWYMDDLKSTREILTAVLDRPEKEFTYYASW
jgi:hypothetical protein